ncbi:MAG: flavin-containing monooxygenase [Mycobacteriales bacterium]
MDRPLPAHVGALVIGSGFAGLAAAIRLAEAGHTVAVLERGSDVGGTWRVNSYPGCACDVPSHLYSYSFAPNPSWTRTFSPQPEIQAYLRTVADDFGVRDSTWFDTEVLSANWEGARWLVSTTRGDLTADVVVAGTGGLSEPVAPKVTGLETFTGAVFHSATWDHSYDFTGKRVAVIGTGASAIQFAPEVAEVAAHLTVFQRTAPWVLPRRDRAVTRFERALFRLAPWTQRAVRGLVYAGRESWVLGFSGKTRLLDVGEKQARAFIARSVVDPELRAKVTPDYKLGCKRVLLSNTWYPMLSRDHVDLVTDPIARITETGLVTSTGQVVDVDVILLGTGFAVTDQPIAHRVRGADGRTLAEHWSGTGMQAYHGMTVPGFPNLFILTGPNTGLGHTSIVYIIERQVEHLVAGLGAMRSAGVKAISPDPAVTKAYNAKLQRQLEGTVWNAGGCASWYLDAHGTNTTLWPTYSFSFARELASFDLRDYELTF